MAEHADTLRAYIHQLRNLVAELQEITEHSRAILSAHRRAGGLTRAELVEQLTQVLEGDEWRRTQELRNRICEDCHKDTTSKHRHHTVMQKAKHSRMKQREALAASFGRKRTTRRAKH
jgi:hypothetical protein